MTSNFNNKYSWILNGSMNVSQRGNFGGYMLHIRREQVKVKITKLNKKHKGKYRFSAVAEAPIYSERGDPSIWYSENPPRLLKSNKVFSKTEHGAKVSAVTSLLHKCRPPLTKKEKAKGFKRSVYIEVRMSNAFDFIMADSKMPCYEIKREVS